MFLFLSTLYLVTADRAPHFPLCSCPHCGRGVMQENFTCPGMFFICLFLHIVIVLGRPMSSLAFLRIRSCFVEFLHPRVLGPCLILFSSVRYLPRYFVFPHRFGLLFLDARASLHCVRTHLRRRRHISVCLVIYLTTGLCSCGYTTSA